MGENPCRLLPFLLLMCLDLGMPAAKFQLHLHQLRLAWHSGEAYCRNFRRWRPFVLPGSPYDCSFFTLVQNNLLILQNTFMLCLELMGPGGILSVLLLLRHTGEMRRVSLQAAMAKVTNSCDRTMAELIHLQLGPLLPGSLCCVGFFIYAMFILINISFKPFYSDFFTYITVILFNLTIF